MQFAVILHECFKCHTCYSTSIKVGWMANTLFSKEMFYSGSPGIIDSELLPITYACKHRENTHTANKITVCVLHWIQTNTQFITYVHMQSYREVFVSLSPSNWESSFLRSLHVLLQLICKGSKLSWPCMPHTHTRPHTETHTPFPHSTMCYDWQIDWPTYCGCGKTWQVEIGKWEAHFSLPSAEQKIKAFSSTEAIARGGVQGVQVAE